jgi:hypothetical protein
LSHTWIPLAMVPVILFPCVVSSGNEFVSMTVSSNSSVKIGRSMSISQGERNRIRPRACSSLLLSKPSPRRRTVIKWFRLQISLVPFLRMFVPFDGYECLLSRSQSLLWCSVRCGFIALRGSTCLFSRFG